MNKGRGFTLVEMLSIIAVLGVIVTLVFPIIGESIDSKKEKELNKVIDIVESAGKAYFSFNDDTYKVDINTLENEKYLIKKLTNPNTDEKIDGCVRKTLNDEDTFIYTYGSCNPIEVQFSVVLNGGTPSQEFKSTYDDSAKIVLLDPTHTSADFKGWQIVKGNSIIKGNTLIIGTTETELYANFEHYPKLTVDLDLGSDNVEYDEAYKSGTVIKLEVPNRKNYTFKGWEIESGNSVISGNNLIIGSTDTVVKAKWEINKYELVVNLNHGQTTQTFNNIYEVGTEIQLVEPTRTGYTFINWTVEGLDSKISNNILTMGDAITSVTANWQANEYVISYEKNGGTLTETSLNVTYGQKYNNLSTPEKLGYSFGGWYTESNLINKVDNNTVVNIASNHTLYAKWILEPVAINNVPTITMTQSTAKAYYGKKVKTVNGTAFNPNTADSRTWRVFYIDTENKYGDGKGTIYLKADELSSKKTRFSTTFEETSASGYTSKFTTTTNTRYYKISSNNIVNSSGTVINTLYLKLNPTYAVGRKKISSTILYEHEKAAAYLCDKTKFTAYTDSRVNYAVGSPPLEMWIDSWNSLYGSSGKFYYRYNVNVDGTTETQKLPGYQLKLNSESWGQAAGAETIDIGTIDKVAMYKTSIGLWFSSPSIVFGGASLVRLSSSGFIGNATINMSNAYSPVVSLKSDVFVITQ